MYIIIILEKDVNGRLIYVGVLYNQIFKKEDVEGVIETAQKEDQNYARCEYIYKPVSITPP